jgi:hypothetical protein
MLTSSQTTSEHCCSCSSLEAPAGADDLQEERELRLTDGWCGKQVTDRWASFSLVLIISEGIRPLPTNLGEFMLSEEALGKVLNSHI